MKAFLGRLLPAALLFLAMAGKSAAQTYDHVVVVVLENHGYDLINSYGSNPSTGLPYINGILRPNSADMTQAYSLEHPSQPNYYWLFSGSNQGLINQSDPDDPPTPGGFTTPNLGASLQSKGLTFAGFAMGLPNDGNTTNDYTETNGDTYARRHVPWTGFVNMDGPSINRTFTDFTNITTGGNYSALPTVSFVIPDLEHDMHNFPQGVEVSNATTAISAAQMSDAWLQSNIEPYRQWALNNNSLLIMTWDEDQTNDWGPPSNPAGLTDPGQSVVDNGNQITMLFSGDHVIDGQYAEGNGVTNVNLLWTIESLYGAPLSGAQSQPALDAGITQGPISDIFAVPEPGSTAAICGVASLMLAGVSRRFGKKA